MSDRYSVSSLAVPGRSRKSCSERCGTSRFVMSSLSMSGPLRSLRKCALQNGYAYQRPSPSRLMTARSAHPVTKQCTLGLLMAVM